MKTRSISLIAAALLALWTGLAGAAPKAVVSDSNYEFPPTSEGQKLTHEFIVKNEGDTELNILSVLPP
ncbi:MAG: hypothetical protein HUN04_24280 [Desulfobacter sp.]|nr:MAG: hypothetical protein HUN04_24280 [Desulfobacter sp.]